MYLDLQYLLLADADCVGGLGLLLYHVPYAHRYRDVDVFHFRAQRLQLLGVGLGEGHGDDPPGVEVLLQHPGHLGVDLFRRGRYYHGVGLVDAGVREDEPARGVADDKLHVGALELLEDLVGFGAEGYAYGLELPRKPPEQLPSRPAQSNDNETIALHASAPVYFAIFAHTSIIMPWTRLINSFLFKRRNIFLYTRSDM